MLLYSYKHGLYETAYYFLNIVIQTLSLLQLQQLYQNAKAKCFYISEQREQDNEIVEEPEDGRGQEQDYGESGKI